MQPESAEQPFPCYNIVLVMLHASKTDSLARQKDELSTGTSESYKPCHTAFLGHKHMIIFIVAVEN
jgi:hypothetical protein